MADRDDEVVLIWSGEHAAWWRPGGQGYTTRRHEAGKWTRVQAAMATAHCGREKCIVIQRWTAGPLTGDEALAALRRVMPIINRLAGAGITFEDVDDPADVWSDLAERLGLTKDVSGMEEADDTMAEALGTLAP